MKIQQHNRAKYFLLPFLLLLMVSCEKEANISINDVDDKIVILSTFTPNQHFSLKLSKSTSLFSSNSSESLETAEIQICKGDNCELLGPGTSVSGSDDLGLSFSTRNFRPQVDVPYSLKVKVAGIEEEVSAQASVPKAVELSHVAIGASSMIPLNPQLDDEVQYETKVAISFDDPIGEDNYYQVNFYQVIKTTDGIDELYDSTINNIDYLSIDSDLVNLRNVQDDGILIDGKNFDGLTREYLFRPIFKYNPLNQEPVGIKVELRTISKEYFDYYSSVYRQINQGSDPFIQPVQIVGNIKNGLGIFAGYSTNSVVYDLEL